MVASKELPMSGVVSIHLAYVMVARVRLLLWMLPKKIFLLLALQFLFTPVYNIQKQIRPIAIVFSVKCDVLKISYGSETDKRLKYIFGCYLKDCGCLPSAIVKRYVHPIVQTLGCTFKHSNLDFPSALEPKFIREKRCCLCFWLRVVIGLCIWQKFNMTALESHCRSSASSE